MHPDLIRRFHLALPKVRSWIDQYIAAHAAKARRVNTLGFSRLGIAYSNELLERTKVVTVDRVPFPPVDQFGLPEFADVQNMQFDGITFKDTFFLRRGCESESLHFHELVHAVQWARLGVDNFLLAYGLGLSQADYANSPLEAMAYALQGLFDRDALPTDVVRTIEQRTDVIWSGAAPIVHR
jgi:hypothetical protein